MRSSPRPEPADVGQPVERDVVVCRPAVLGGRRRSVRQEGLESLVARRRVGLVSEPVALAADDQRSRLPSSRRRRAHRSRRLVDADVHAARAPTRVDRRGDRVRLGRVRLREEEAAVEERQLGRDDDVAGADASPRPSRRRTERPLRTPVRAGRLEDVAVRRRRRARASALRYFQGWNCAWPSTLIAAAIGYGRSVSVVSSASTPAARAASTSRSISRRRLVRLRRRRSCSPARSRTRSTCSSTIGRDLLDRLLVRAGVARGGLDAV